MWRRLAFLSLFTGGCRRSELDPGVRRTTTTTTRDLAPAPGELALPVRDGSVRFAVIGDSGRGDQPQHEIARQMAAWRAKFPFDFVLMLGDNIYGPHTPRDYELKFEEPYRALLEAGVTFHAASAITTTPARSTTPASTWAGAATTRSAAPSIGWPRWPAPASGSSRSTAAHSTAISCRGSSGSWRPRAAPGRSRSSTTRSTPRAATPRARDRCGG